MVKVPNGRLQDQFSRSAKSGLWLPAAQALDRNFAEVEKQFASDGDRLTALENHGAAWADAGGSVTQGVAITKTNTFARARTSKELQMAFWAARLTLTSAGTAGSAVILTLPFALTSATPHPIGYATFSDVTGAAVRYSCLIFSANSTTANIIWSEDQTATNFFGIDPAVTIANGDVLDIWAWWESTV